MHRYHIPIIILAVLAGILAVVLIFPVINIIITSDPGLLLAAIRDKEVFHSITLTLECAGYATLLALVFGVPLAYLLARFSFWGKSFIEAAINIPIIIPHAAAGIALLTVLSHGFVVGDIVKMTNVQIIDTKLGITIAMFFVSSPFLINNAIIAFNSFDAKLEKNCPDAWRWFWRTFFAISLPLSFRGIIKGALMMWGRGISEFGAVVILAYHPMITSTLIFERFESYGLKHSKPVAALLILLCLVFFSFIIYAGNSHARHKEY